MAVAWVGDPFGGARLVMSYCLSSSFPRDNPLLLMLVTDAICGIAYWQGLVRGRSFEPATSRNIEWIQQMAVSIYMSVSELFMAHQTHPPCSVDTNTMLSFDWSSYAASPSSSQSASLMSTRTPGRLSCVNI